jgi:hypothetical protein
MLQCGWISGRNTKASPKPDTLFLEPFPSPAIFVPTTDLAALECHLPRSKSFR